MNKKIENVFEQYLNNHSLTILTDLYSYVMVVTDRMHKLVKFHLTSRMMLIYVLRIVQIQISD